MANFDVPDLPYAYDALEPYISEQIMKLHHDKHHVGYTNRLNASVEKYAEWGDKNIDDILKEYSNAPEDIKDSLRNNGGGFYNHALFWNMMSGTKDQTPSDEVSEKISGQFGSIDNFKKEFGDSAKKLVGSGWAWLVMDNGKLSIMTTPNQDTPITFGKDPLLCIDVWEHAYYLQYFADRAAYVDAWWHVVNWEYVAKKFEEAKK